MPIIILLVEDSPTQAAVSRRDLETISPDVKVEIATTASAALNRAQNVSLGLPDLIILDMTLPDGNGLDVCRYLKNNAVTSAIPVVIFSVEALSKHRQEAYAAGANQ